MTELLCKAILKLQEIFKRFVFLSGKHSRSPTKQNIQSPARWCFVSFISLLQNIGKILTTNAGLGRM